MRILRGRVTIFLTAPLTVMALLSLGAASSSSGKEEASRPVSSPCCGEPQSTSTEQGSSTQAGPYGHTVKKDVMVPMRDGVKLATDIYLPTRNGVVVSEKLPTVMVRLPYNKEAPAWIKAGEFYASHGYAVVIQDVRGRFKSEGVWVRFNDDANDGTDTGEPLNEHRRMVTATNTVYHDRDHPSHIILPLIPRASAPTSGN